MPTTRGHSLSRTTLAGMAVATGSTSPSSAGTRSIDLTQKAMGEYPRGPVKPGGALDRLFDRYKNHWGNISASSGAGALGRDPAFGQQFQIRRADRIMFGTDYLKPNQVVPQFDLMLKFDLPPEVRAKVERTDAAKLLGLKL